MAESADLMMAILLTAPPSMRSWPYFVAIGDLDGDGTSDLVAVNNGSNTVSVLLGSGNETFAKRRRISRPAARRIPWRSRT